MARAPSSSTTIPNNCRLGGCGTTATAAPRMAVGVVLDGGSGENNGRSRVADKSIERLRFKGLARVPVGCSDGCANREARR